MSAVASPQARARHLLERLRAIEVDVVPAAEEARLVFSALGDRLHLLWLTLELGGYGVLTDNQPLHSVLGVQPGDRLATHVAGYRTQVGWRWGQQAPRFAHFFVEPLGELVTTRDRVRAARTTGLLELSFGPQQAQPDYPRSGDFSADVFQRILLGFTATLHLHLQDVAS